MKPSLTPTAMSASVAGFGFYALVWSIAAHLDSVTALVGFKNRGYARRVRNWINRNRSLTLCITEVINFSIHGITNPAAVTFAIGGTMCNILYVMLINPLMCIKDRKYMKPILVPPVARKQASL